MVIDDWLLNRMFLNDYYEKYKKFSVSFREKYFPPVLHLLAILRITPNQLTTFRLIFIVPIVYYFVTENLAGVFIFYVIFWVLDLFDGALARYLNKTSDKGRFLDTIVDNFMYGVLMVGMIDLQVAWLWLLALNIVLEYTVQILGIIKKQSEFKTDWILKAQADLPYFKSVSHIALFLFFCGLNYLNLIYYILDLWLLGTALSLYFYIKDKT